MRHLARFHDLLLGALAAVGALATVALMAHVIVDVLLRNLFNTPIPATYEIVTRYYMIALAFVPLAFVESKGGMVQVEVIDSFIGPAAVAVLERLVAAFSAVVYGILAWVSLSDALKNAEAGTFVLAQNHHLPVWPGYFLPVAGFALASVAVAIRAVRPTQPRAA